MSYELKRMIGRIDEELSLIEQREGLLAIFDEGYAKLKKKRRILTRVLARFERIEKGMGKRG